MNPFLSPFLTPLVIANSRHQFSPPSPVTISRRHLCSQFLVSISMAIPRLHLASQLFVINVLRHFLSPTFVFISRHHLSSSFLAVTFWHYFLISFPHSISFAAFLEAVFRPHFFSSFSVVVPRHHSSMPFLVAIYRCHGSSIFPSAFVLDFALHDLSLPFLCALFLSVTQCHFSLPFHSIPRCNYSSALHRHLLSPLLVVIFPLHFLSSYLSPFLYPLYVCTSRHHI